MIASTSAIRSLFLITLAVASCCCCCRANKDSNSATLLRGNRQQQQRDLVEVGMGEMVCKEFIPYDGSVVCTFRTMPPADLVSRNVHHGCIYGSQTTGSNFCLAAEVYRAVYAYGDVAIPVISNNPVTTVTPLQPVVQPVAPPVTNINANVNNQVVTAEAATTTSTTTNTGSILPIFNNPEKCPTTKPDDGVSCEWGARCGYLLEVKGVETDALYCDCNWSCVFHCRNSTHPFFQTAF